jgi:hypothetical protein
MAQIFKAENEFMPFPSQKRAESRKTDSFYKECINAGVSLINSEVGAQIRATKKNMIVNYDLVSNKVHDSEVQRAVNPFGIEYGKLPENYRNCPLLNTNLMLLWGEERKRFFRPIVTVINSDAVNDKLRRMDDIIEKFLTDQVVNSDLSEEQIVERLRELDDWKNFQYRDRRERMAQQIVEYGFNILNLREEFSRGFEDLTISGDAIYIVDIVSGEPVLRKGDPVGITTIRGGQSNKAEDSDIIIEDRYLPIGQVIDEYYEELKESDITKLEEGARAHKPSSGFMGDQLIHGPSNLDAYIEAVGIGEIVVGANASATRSYGKAFDEEGNVRVTRVLWKGLRKVGKVSYFDEVGNEQEIIVPENYEPNTLLGETVEWMWISEWYEGTQIAEDIYVKMGPRPVQFRSMDNISKCSPGIVGITTNVGTNQATSIVDLAKDYQYLYNAVLQKMEMSIAKDFGVLGRLDLSMIPDEWPMDKWLYYAYMMGWMVEDPFNEGKKGQSMGKLAGTMNQNSKAIDLSQGRFIQGQLEILAFLENRVDAITGITPQRKGAVDNRETVGGVERAVTQSSHSTEKWFSIHDYAKIKAVESYIETAKVAWKGKSFKRNYVLDDSSLAILDYDSQIFNEAEYGVYVSTASSDMEMMQQLKSLTQPFMQNGGSMSIIMDIFRTKDPASLQRKIERYEKQMQEREQQQLEADRKAQAEALARQETLEKYKVDATNQAKIDVALIQAESNNGEIEEDKLALDEEVHADKMTLEAQKLEETKRANRAKEKLDGKKLSYSKTTKS